MFNWLKRHTVGEEPKEAEKRIDVNVVNAIELKADSTYLIVADSRHVSKEDILTVRQELKRQGIKQVVGFLLSGAPEDAVQFVQSNNPKKRRSR